MFDYILEEEEEENEEGIKTRVGKIKVESTYTGFNCFDQFVEWLMQNAVIRLSINSKKLAHPSMTSPGQYLREYQNYFFAHNGARFDFRFLIDKLSKFCEIEITGTKSQMKKMKFKNVHFVDSFLLLPFSLKKLCKTFKTPNKKFPYDIEGVTLLNWRDREQ